MIISNDYMYFSKVISKAKLLNNVPSAFSVFHKNYNMSPFEWLNEKENISHKTIFVYKNYTPVGEDEN